LKNRYCRKQAATALSLLFLCLTVAAQQPQLRFEQLPNFHKVNERLYRGGQPKKDGLKKLAELGIKTIINLRGESDETKAEGNEAESLGMQFFNIPMSSAGRPTEEQVERLFQIIESSENVPVFIHCRRGSDRTGVIVALSRIKHDGWTDKQALDEAKRYGMGFIQFGKRDYIKDYFTAMSKQ
jgi:tyrosine-protein phosphatase SIW14